MKQYDIFPECNVDTNLIGYLLGGYPKHKSSCNEVVKAVNNKDGFAIGIIDADKRLATLDPGFVKFNELDLSAENECEREHITMYIHQDEKRYIFTITPAMDKFILDAAKQQKVDMKQAGFPNKLETFIKLTKRIQSANDAKLRNLFDKIKSYPELQRFRNTIKYLLHCQINADLKLVKSFFNGELSNMDLVDLLNKHYDPTTLKF